MCGVSVEWGAVVRWGGVHPPPLTTPCQVRLPTPKGRTTVPFRITTPRADRRRPVAVSTTAIAWGHETARAALHRGDCPPEGPSRRGRLEHARSRAGGRGLHGELAMAQSRRVRKGSSGDRRVPPP